MVSEKYYCGCGRQTENEGLCERCEEKWEYEKDKIRRYVDNNNLDSEDREEIEKKVWKKMNLRWRVVRYCTYGEEGCGAFLEDGETYCSSCVKIQKQRELDALEEKRRRRKAVNDY